MVDLKSLIGKLNGLSRGALEAALGLAASGGHYSVELEHWVLKLLDAADGDALALIRHYEVDVSRLRADLDRVIKALKSGNTRTPALAPQVVDLAREAWLIASLEDGAPQVRSGHLLCALLSGETLARAAREMSGQFARVPVDALRRDRAIVTAATAEATTAAVAAAAPGGNAPAAPGGERALDKFTIDLTARARAGKIDPVLGRDPEIRQVIDILTRRRQNNPILTGEAGVGKTAVVEGFALRIAAGEVPAALKPVSVRTLDLGLLQAGAGMRGEFENRLKSVIEEVQASPSPIVLFIDEAHTLIGAGGQAGQNDAANLLKPALARGDLRTIAATTWAEYKKYFERDAALARRFQVVKVEEPGEAAAVAMMRGLVATLERHHKVRILDQAVIEAVRLSHRYVTGRQLPDKAVSLLDTACARVAMSAEAVPAAIEDLRREIEILTTEIGILERESAAGSGDRDRLEASGRRRDQAAVELTALEARWQEEGATVAIIRRCREQLEAAPGALDADALALAKSNLEDATAKLKTLQGEAPLIHPCVDGDAVAAVVANWTGIPVGRMVSNEIRSVLDLRQRMAERVVGQPHALNAIAEAIQTSRAKLTDPRKPIGVFLMVGTSGVGKTETALALADLLYGGEQNMSVINMSEFKEEHKVSTLMGSPPGYVGYGEGGVLTEAVRRRPYSVILFDEMEKAHSGVQDVFYQLFDKGMLRDGEGRDIDFKNTLIIMTSNAGTDTIHKLCADPETMPGAEGLAEALRPDLLKVFKPAFLGRVTVVPYFPLADDILRQITALQLGRIRKRIESNYRASFTYTPAVLDSIVARCKEVQSGARNIDHILSRGVLPTLSEHFLSRLAEDRKISAVEIGVDEDGAFTYGIV